VIRLRCGASPRLILRRASPAQWQALEGGCPLTKWDQSVNTTDCTPEISKRLRQRIFLHAIMSSLRTM
jgi:hypothetical protein